MYKIHDGNTIVYETLDELLNEKILWMTERRDYYYIKLEKEREDDSVWEVNKNTGKAKYMQYPMYLVEVEEEATDVDPKTLQRVS